MSGRNQTDQMLAAMCAPVVRPVYLFEGEFEGGTVRYWTGIRPLIWEGNVFQGWGKLVGVSGIEEINDIEAGGITVGLAGVSSEDLSLGLASARQNKVGTVYFGLMDSGPVVPVFNISDPGLVSDQVQDWAGLAGVTVTDDGDYGVVTASAGAGDHAVYQVAAASFSTGDKLYQATRLRRGTTRYGVAGILDAASGFGRVATVDFDATRGQDIVTHSNNITWSRARRLPDGDVFLETVWIAAANGLAYAVIGPSPLAANNYVWGGVAAGTESVKVRRSMLYHPITTNGHDLVRDPVIAFRGRLDFTESRVIPKTDESPELNVIQVRYENELSMLGRAMGGRYTGESQRKYFPNDRGFDYVEDIHQREIKWGGG